MSDLQTPTADPSNPGNDPSSNPLATTPAQMASSMPDNSTGTGTQNATQTPSATNPPPAQAPAPQAPANAAPANAAPAQVPSVQPKPSQTGTISNQTPTQTPDYSNHPAVKRAGLMSTIARTLVGSPVTTTIDPQTGAVTRKPAPLTNRQISLAIVMEALSGAAAGAEAKPGPGVEGRAAGAGFSAGAGEVEQRNAQQEAQAKSDADSQNQAFMHKATLYHLNMESAQLAASAANMEGENYSRIVDANKASGVLLDPDDPNLISSIPMTKDEMTQKMASKEIDPGAHLGAMAGFTSVRQPDGTMHDEPTFQIINDPSAKSDVTPEQWKYWASQGVRGIPANYATKPPDSTVQISNSMRQSFANQAANHDQTDQRLAIMRSNLKGTPFAAQVPTSVEWSTPGVQTAMSKFNQYVSHDIDSSADPYRALQLMAANPNDRKYVATVMQSLGGHDLLLANHNALAPIPEFKNADAAIAFKVAHSDNPRMVQAANTAVTAFNKQDAQQKLLDAQAEAQGKANVDNSKTENTNDVDAIGTGHIAPERMSYLLARNPQLLDAVMQKYPDFDSSKAESYQHTYRDFTSGKTSQALNNGATALNHLNDLSALNTPASHIPHTNAWTAYQNQLDTVVSELGKFYGNDTIPGLAGYRKTLDTTLPGNRAAAIHQQAHAMGEKLDSYEQEWSNAAPSAAYQAPMPGISDKAKAARAALDPTWTPQGHGQKIDLPTVKIYLRQNGNDAQKAAAAAKANGWNF